MKFYRSSFKHRAFLVLLGVAATAFLCLSSPADAARRRSAARQSVYSPPYSAMVVDAKTGKVLHAENPDALRYPASITKVMTLYLLFEQLNAGKLKLNSRLSISANASRQPPSKLGLVAGSTISVEDAILALVTKSANDAAVVVAENIGGSEAGFARLMNLKAKSLGMRRTVYRNPNGLPNPRQVTTARDLTILGRAIQDQFPTYYRYFQAHEFSFNGRQHANHNRLLGRVEGVDGIKTGYTRASGFNLLSSVKNDNRQIVAVVLGGRSGSSRDAIMAGLIDQHMHRAYAGARTAPQIVENRQNRLPSNEDEAEVETTAAVATPLPRQLPGQPLAINSLRPAVTIVSDADSTATPGSAGTYKAKDNQILPKNQAQPKNQAMPKNALAFAAPPAKGGKEKASAPEPETVKTKGWFIQLAATQDEASARDILDNAKSRSGRALTQVSPITEKIVRDGTTLYRARFSGFSQSQDAQNACNSLKRNGFSCFASRG